MTLTSRRRALALMGSTALAACTAPAVITRDRSDPFEGGIGGTGIVGILTGRERLIVNGLSVDMTDETVVETALGPADAGVLAPGLALTVQAKRLPDRLIAERVTVDYALVGPLRGNGEGRFAVNGAPVIPEPGAMGEFAVGRRVAVSGAWSRDGLVASRIDPAPQDLDLVAGTVSLGDPAGLSIAGVRVRTSAPRPGSGEYAVALGRAEGDGAFLAERLVRGRLTGATDLRQLSVEGYLEPIGPAPGYRIAGLGHSFGRGLRLEQLAARRAIYFGPYDGRFNASAGYVVPEDFEARRGILERGYDAGFAGEIVSTG